MPLRILSTLFHSLPPARSVAAARGSTAPVRTDVALAMALFSGLSLSACQTSHEAPDDVTDAGTCVPSVARGPVDLTHLPVGDPRILMRNDGDASPEVGALWLCAVPMDGRGASDTTDWSNSPGTWDYTRKPTVEGSVMWESEFAVTLDGAGNRVITGNGLPSFPTGVFPVAPGTIAYTYDRNPSHIEEHLVNLTLPAIPEVAAAPSCVPYGPSGISLAGNAIYHGASTLGTDAAAGEMLDECGGQSDGTLTYHTHFLSDCLLDALDNCTEGHSALMGYMLDGFGIFGPRGEDGQVLTSEQLDECHGHTHEIDWDGERISLYHYHWTYDFPYNIGCFKGTPIPAGWQ